MKFHIVRTQETLKDILFIYDLTEDELKENNQHIRSWDKLIPGTKLRIPAITESMEMKVSDIEPFIEDYYPKLTHNINSPLIPIDEEEKYMEIDSNVDTSYVNIKSTNYEEIEAVEEKKVVEYDPYEVLNKYSNNNEHIKENNNEQLSNHNPQYFGYYNGYRNPLMYYPIYYVKKP